MLVKCQDTGEKIEKNLAFKVEKMNSSGKMSAKYYSSEEAYNKIVENKKYKEQCIDLFYEILEYKSFMKIPTFFYKKLSEWEPYGYKVVLTCIEDNVDSLRWAIANKEFSQESGKIMYMCAIVENHMNDALKKVNMEKKIQEKRSVEITIDDVSVGNNRSSNSNAVNLLGDI